MAEFPFLPLATDAYLADTTHLSTEEHGAYLLMLMAAWRAKECRLPDNDVYLARVCRCTARVWLRIRPILAPFWTIEDGWWSQKRLTKERRYVDSVRVKRVAAAYVKHGKNSDGRVTNSPTDDAPKPLPPNDTTPAHAGARALHPHPHPIEEKKEESPVGDSKKEIPPPELVEAVAPPAPPATPPQTLPPPRRANLTVRGTRLPEDWEPGPDGMAYAVGVGLTLDQAQDQAERMRLWVKNAPGSKAIKKDWHAFWQGWCRRAADDIAKRPNVAKHSRDGPRPFNSWVDAHEELVNMYKDRGDYHGDEDEPGTYPLLPREASSSRH